MFLYKLASYVIAGKLNEWISDPGMKPEPEVGNPKKN